MEALRAHAIVWSVSSVMAGIYHSQTNVGKSGARNGRYGSFLPLISGASGREQFKETGQAFSPDLRRLVRLAYHNLAEHIMTPKFHILTMTAALAISATAQAEPRSYDAAKADQFLNPLAEDIVPEDATSRLLHMRHTAYNAAMFGQVAVLTYNQIYAQAVDRNSARFVGFNRFAHDRDLAGPGYATFKTPNADTLYSNAYLDLSQGPVLLTVPPTKGRYYTVNLLDLYGNATNISARTHGTSGGRYMVATTEWGGDVPQGVTLFRVTQPYMWILMRIEAENPAVVPIVRQLQDAFTLAPMGRLPADRDFPEPGTIDNPAAFLKILDWVVEQAGVRNEELAHVHGFRDLGVGGPRTVDEALADDAVKQGVTAGFADARTVIASSVAQNGVSTNGWREPLDIGRYGFNYNYRASVNSLGTGANVRLENFAFTTFEDADGEPLDGAKHDYVLRMASPPPANFFWSVTAYDRKTQELIPNAERKYLVSDNTEGLIRGEDGSITIIFSQQAGGPNAIPIPDGPFYLALRAQGPGRKMLDGTWRPTPVKKLQR